MLKFADVKSQIIQNMRDFHQLEVVGRVSETQFQVGTNLNGSALGFTILLMG